MSIARILRNSALALLLAMTVTTVIAVTRDSMALTPLSEMCVCCDNGGLLDMALTGDPYAADFTGINPNSGAQYPCGNIGYQACTTMNGASACSGDRLITNNSCGQVKEYQTQQQQGPGGD